MMNMMNHFIASLVIIIALVTMASAQISGGPFGPPPSGTATAASTSVDASGFSGNLSAADDTVQKALVTIDAMAASVTKSAIETAIGYTVETLVPSKSSIEIYLVGLIDSHFHSYLSNNGGTVSGPILFDSAIQYIESLYTQSGTWNATTPGVNGTDANIAYGNGVFIIAYGQSNAVRRSSDGGATWSNVTNDPNLIWWDIATDGAGKWATISDNGSTPYCGISEDNGLTFSNTGFTPPAILRFITYIGSKFYAVGTTGNNVYVLSYVSPGVWSWTSVTGVSIGTTSCIASEGLNGIVLGSAGAMRTIDGGTTWSAISAPSGTYNGVDINGHVVCAIGPSDFARSEDLGDTWTYQTPPSSHNWTDIASNDDGQWVAVASTGTTRIWSSINNGVSFSAIAAPQNDTYWSIAASGDQFCATSKTTYSIYIDNGLTPSGLSMKAPALYFNGNILESMIPSKSTTEALIGDVSWAPNVTGGQFSTNRLPDNAAFTGEVTANTHRVISRQDVGGAQSVAGAATFDSTLGVTGAVELKSTLTVGSTTDLATAYSFQAYVNGALGAGGSCTVLGTGYNNALVLDGTLAGGIAALYAETQNGTATTDLKIGSSAANVGLYWDTSAVSLGINDDTPSYGLDVNGTGRYTGALTLDSTLGVGSTPLRSGLATFAGSGATYNQIVLADTQAYNASPTIQLNFSGKYAAAGTYGDFAAIRGTKVNTTDGSQLGNLSFLTNSGSAATVCGIANSSGNWTLGATDLAGTTSKLAVNGTVEVITGCGGATFSSTNQAMYVKVHNSGKGFADIPVTVNAQSGTGKDFFRVTVVADDDTGQPPSITLVQHGVAGGTGEFISTTYTGITLSGGTDTIGFSIVNWGALGYYLKINADNLVVNNRYVLAWANNFK